MAAVRALRSVYDGNKVTFEVQSIQDDTAAGLAEKHFPQGKHGLIAYDGDGKIIDKIEGHRFGEAEIRAIVDKLIG